MGHEIGLSCQAECFHRGPRPLPDEGQIKRGPTREGAGAAGKVLLAGALLCYSKCVCPRALYCMSTGGHPTAVSHYFINRSLKRSAVLLAMISSHWGENGPKRKKQTKTKKRFTFQDGSLFLTLARAQAQAQDSQKKVTHTVQYVEHLLHTVDELADTRLAGVSVIDRRERTW